MSGEHGLLQAGKTRAEGVWEQVFRELFGPETDTLTCDRVKLRTDEHHDL